MKLSLFIFSIILVSASIFSISLARACLTNSDCDDSNPKTFDQCLQETGSCNYTNIACLSDADCGFTGFTGREFCFQNNVFKNFQNSTCINPSSVSSYCNVSVSGRLVQNCDDLNPATVDSCIDAGTSAFCQHNLTEIACRDNSDCGTNYLSGNICSGLNVIKNYLNYSCNNPNTAEAFCSNISGSYTQQTCADECSSGACVSFNCHNNLDCGINAFQGGLFCSGKNVTRNFVSFICNNPGTSNSFCSNSTAAIINKTCIDQCTSGNCISFSCHNNLDCGTDGFRGSNFCSGNNVTRNFVTYTCNNPGTSNSVCTNTTSQLLNQTCRDFCSNGQCFSFNCSQDSDCGSSSSSKFCKGSDVYERTTELSCVNHVCEENTGENFVESCGQCFSGACVSHETNLNNLNDFVNITYPATVKKIKSVPEPETVGSNQTIAPASNHYWVVVLLGLLIALMLIIILIAALTRR